MGRQLAATPWEIEAARRQEVVAADFGADRPSKINGAARNGRLSSAVARFVRAASSDPDADALAPKAQGALRTAKPGA